MIALAESGVSSKTHHEIESQLEELGLYEEPIVIRSTGCPNGCGRPYLGKLDWWVKCQASITFI